MCIYCLLNSFFAFIDIYQHLKTNLAKRCDRGGNCDNRQIRRCIGCRLARCLAMGMKPDYIRQLRIKSIQRRIDKIPKDKQLLKFSETLDPFQALAVFPHL